MLMMNVSPNLACFNPQLTARMSPRKMGCNYRTWRQRSHTCKASNSTDFQWAEDASSPRMTKKHILPDDKKPILSQVSHEYIPVIDMSMPVDIILPQISSACEEYGFFQIINHKIPHELCQTMLDVLLDLFHSPPQYKAQFFSEDSTQDVRICHYYRTDQTTKEKIPMWSEVFKHSWHPVDDFTQTLPMNPPEYREVIGIYAKHVGKLMSSLLSLMSQGLGLDPDCLNTRIGENPTYRVQANYYPPCPNPEDTLGLDEHYDRDALTVILPTPEMAGLQVMKDDKWIVVNPLPNALFVNIGDQLQVLSNGKYKSVLHRAITNKARSRISLAMFYGPGKDTITGPIPHLIDEKHPPVYQSYRFSDFLEEFYRQEGSIRMVKEAFELRKSV